MSLIILNKFSGASQPAVPANKVGMFWDLDKNAVCFIDEFGYKWYAGDQRVSLTADLSGNNTVTLQDMSGVFFPLRANTLYSFEFRIIFAAQSATTGIKLGLTTPTSPTTFTAHVDLPGVADGVGALYSGEITSSGDSVVSPGEEAATPTQYQAWMRGSIKNGSTAGNLQVQFASEVAGQAIVPKLGTSGRLWFP